MGDLPETMIKYKGVFDFDGLLRMIYDWLVYQKFEVLEDNFKYAVSNPKGDYEELKWKSERKIDAYHQYKLDIEMKFWDLKTVEVDKGGKKVNMQFARLKIILQPATVEDYSGIFGGSNFNKGLGKFFKNFILRQDSSNIHEDTMYYWTYKLHHNIKKFLNMETQVNVFEGRA